MFSRVRYLSSSPGEVATSVVLFGLLFGTLFAILGLLYCSTRRQRCAYFLFRNRLFVSDPLTDTCSQNSCPCSPGPLLSAVNDRSERSGPVEVLHALSPHERETLILSILQTKVGTAADNGCTYCMILQRNRSYLTSCSL
jgi:hypothetical protein